MKSTRSYFSSIFLAISVSFISHNKCKQDLPKQENIVLNKTALLKERINLFGETITGLDQKISTSTIINLSEKTISLSNEEIIDTIIEANSNFVNKLKIKNTYKLVKQFVFNQQPEFKDYLICAFESKFQKNNSTKQLIAISGSIGAIVGFTSAYLFNKLSKNNPFSKASNNNTNSVNQNKSTQQPVNSRPIIKGGPYTVGDSSNNSDIINSNLLKDGETILEANNVVDTAAPSRADSDITNTEPANIIFDTNNFTITSTQEFQVPERPQTNPVIDTEEQEELPDLAAPVKPSTIKSEDSEYDVILINTDKPLLRNLVNHLSQDTTEISQTTSIIDIEDLSSAPKPDNMASSSSHVASSSMPIISEESTEEVNNADTIEIPAAPSAPALAQETKPKAPFRRKPAELKKEENNQNNLINSTVLKDKVAKLRKTPQQEKPVTTGQQEGDILGKILKDPRLNASQHSQPLEKSLTQSETYNWYGSQVQPSEEPKASSSNDISEDSEYAQPLNTASQQVESSKEQKDSSSNEISENLDTTSQTVNDSPKKPSSNASSSNAVMAGAALDAYTVAQLTKIRPAMSDSKNLDSSNSYE